MSLWQGELTVSKQFSEAFLCHSDNHLTDAQVLGRVREREAYIVCGYTRKGVTYRMVLAINMQEPVSFSLPLFLSPLTLPHHLSLSLSLSLSLFLPDHSIPLPLLLSLLQLNLFSYNFLPLSLSLCLSLSLFLSSLSHHQVSKVLSFRSNLCDVAEIADIDASRVKRSLE